MTVFPVAEVVECPKSVSAKWCASSLPEMLGAFEKVKGRRA